MTDEKWSEVIDKIKESFTVEDEGKEDFDDRSGTKDWIVFAGPLGRMKLERSSRKVLLGERSIGARRSGAEQSVVRDYGDEIVQSVAAFHWKDDAWVPLDAGALLTSTTDET